MTIAKPRLREDNVSAQHRSPRQLKADEMRTASPRAEVPTMEIASIDDYERAVQRAHDLADADEDTPDYLELIALIGAIVRWNGRDRQPLMRHDQETPRHPQ